MSGSLARNMSGLGVRNRNTPKPGMPVIGDPEVVILKKLIPAGKKVPAMAINDENHSASLS